MSTVFHYASCRWERTPLVFVFYSDFWVFVVVEGSCCGHKQESKSESVQLHFQLRWWMFFFVCVFCTSRRWLHRRWPWQKGLYKSWPARGSNKMSHVTLSFQVEELPMLITCLHVYVASFHFLKCKQTRYHRVHSRTSLDPHRVISFSYSKENAHVDISNLRPQKNNPRAYPCIFPWSPVTRLLGGIYLVKTKTRQTRGQKIL